MENIGTRQNHALEKKDRHSLIGSKFERFNYKNLDLVCI